MIPVSYINDDVSLASFCESNKDRSQLMLDTEFLRERTFFPVLCLIQIATDDAIVLIDPLAIKKMEPLWHLLTHATLVFHAARQDIEVLSQASNRLPARILDTQIAAALCGFPAQIGYANLVQELLGVSLAKSHTRTDWSRRPLRTSELEYAADDVRYLGQITPVLQDRLENLGRTDWAWEDSNRQLRSELYAEETDQAWRRVKGMNRMREESHRRARVLASWRETVATERNLPRRWVIKDEELVAIASQNPTTIGEVSVYLQSKKAQSRYGGPIIAALASAATDVSDWSPAARPDGEQRATAKRLGQIVQAAAESLEIDSEIIAPQRELKAAAAGDRNLRVFSGWRDKLVGDQLRAELG